MQGLDFVKYIIAFGRGVGVRVDAFHQSPPDTDKPRRYGVSRTVSPFLLGEGSEVRARALRRSTPDTDKPRPYGVPHTFSPLLLGEGSGVRAYALPLDSVPTTADTPRQ